MIIVIQCAATKRSGAGRFISPEGNPVIFVADPRAIAAEGASIYARPDDEAEVGKSWRQLVLSYNTPNDNPFGLLPAYRLYQNPAYERLAERFGVSSLYILSAGWGLISAEFLTPYYDITFSPSAERHKRRLKADRLSDLCLLPSSVEVPIVFFGGKDYVPLFCTLTSNVRSERIVFYNSANPPNAPGCALKRFETTTRTNWHYECANTFIDRGRA